MSVCLNRREFLTLASAGIATTAAGNRLSADETNDRPNVVFLFADQMRAEAMGCMGNEQVVTPHLDRLASEGLLVTNCISASPVCTPYRGQLMTGRYGHATGVVHNDIQLPRSETTIADVMVDRGYQTGYIGKWHLAGHRKNPVAAADRRNWQFWAVRNCSHAHFNPQYWLNDAAKPVEVDGWEPEVQTDLAVEFIRQRQAEPFFLMVSYGPPHNPYKAPQRHQAIYTGKTLDPRPNDPKPNHAQMLNYYAMITSLDECVGRISDELKSRGLADNTIFVFTSDHGDMLGSQGHRLKQRPWEESINVPFIIRYPKRIAAGGRRDTILSSVDLMPTLTHMCGADVPSAVQGLDQTAVLFGEADETRDAAFLFNTHNGGGPGCDWRGIRTKSWVYAYHRFGDWILYDLKNDPHQLNNLIDRPEYTMRRDELRSQLEAMRTDLGEALPLNGVRPAPIRLPV